MQNQILKDYISWNSINAWYEEFYKYAHTLADQG